MRAAVFALAIGLACAGDAMAQGCAMCGTAAGGATDPLARSLSASVLFMMSMPFLIFFSVAGWLVWRFRRAREDHGATHVKENPS
jgi:heme/copper-type cytochrome/quinol oxidase subunit 2